MDIKLVLRAYEEAFKPRTTSMNSQEHHNDFDERGFSPKKKNFKPRNEGNNQDKMFGVP